LFFLYLQSSRKVSSKPQYSNPYSARTRGFNNKRSSAGGGHVFRGSTSRSCQMPRDEGPAAPRCTDTPRFFVSMSDNAKTANAAYAEQPVVGELPSNGRHSGGDYSRQWKPSASSVSNSTKQLAPSVAQLFSSVSPNRRSVRDDVSELLDVYPQGIELNDFCRVFEACFHRPLDSHWTDLSSLRQMLESMAELVEIIEHGTEVIVRQKYGSDYLQGNALQL